ncbi:prolipoprotein diacylglyceryl transferase [Clostridium folliculivorans]|uniref:Phosphatidylglycerol--prolipoprotein diacylglyceryl transferase n=1 Tax=Clostridium folliculivorans TaxID=2886038 RepID=A0A9W6DCU2_9CLOT|nr:prolipoprotein diacylglyceryl transferase [Clostridium folliculivorans]GKU27362.1 prolipoprotein diacylglyceryl transferase [Clostridium folliculivorans]GKU32213.1 prolipoprotein diacylglyceryl transferase [Clostridium folliculivorans]
MNPVAFNIFGLDIRWYGLLISFGVLAALTLGYFTCRLKGTDFDKLMDIFIIAFPMAIIGARLYYVVFEFDYYKNNLNQIINIRQGGLAIHGGVIFALVTAFIYTKIKKLDFFEFADIAAPSIILAQAIGRWGNFFNSEAHGGPVTKEFISKFPEFIQKGMFIDGTYYHPTFLYESLWNVLVCLILLFILYKRKNNHKGIVLGSYMILYSIGRFFIEGLRTDSLYMAYGLRTAQVVSGLGVIFGIIMITAIVRRKKGIFY